MIPRGRAGLTWGRGFPYYQSYPEDGDLLDVPCQWAHERRQFILNHNWGTPHLARLLKTFPDACFINGHTNLSYALLTKEFPNLYICSCPLIPPRACEDAVAALAPDRLLFGSDLEDLPIAWGLGAILAARLPVEIKRQILGGTLQRLLTQYSLHA